MSDSSLTVKNNTHKILAGPKAAQQKRPDKFVFAFHVRFRKYGRGTTPASRATELGMAHCLISRGLIRNRKGKKLDNTK
ncbi:unnamed protein product [Hermetia illucens]|uniref:Uncharacterized protein n=1 Tax=Hermetia illucens TaxID=343691 RepID=A0A7R8UI26_HERIL|nr:unnamed protein product [Hermetia illucens]